MTDLHLTSFERERLPKSDSSVAPKPDEVKPFSEWSSEMQLSPDASFNYLRYADYVRDTMGSSYDVNTEKEIQIGLRQGLTTLGMDEETIEQTLAPPEPTAKQKMDMVFSALGTGDIDRQLILDYKAGQQILDQQGDDVAESYRSQVEDMKALAEDVVAVRFNDAKVKLVNEGKMPFAYVDDPDAMDGRRLIVGDSAITTPLVKGIRSSQMGGVNFTDLGEIQYQLSDHPFSKIPVFQHNRISEITDQILQLSEDDSIVQENLLGHIQHIQSERETLLESGWSSVADFFRAGMGKVFEAVGLRSEEEVAAAERVSDAEERARLNNFDAVVGHITDKLNASGANYNTYDVQDAYLTAAAKTGFASGIFSLRDDDKELSGQNLIMTRLGPVMNPKVFIDEEEFQNTLNSHQELTADQRVALEQMKEFSLTQNFYAYSKALSESSYKDEWSEALLAGRLEGKSNKEILKEFVDSGVYNEVFDTAVGVGRMFVEAGLETLLFLAQLGNKALIEPTLKSAGKMAGDNVVGDILQATPDLLGSVADTGFDKIAEWRAKRRQEAEIFGEAYGVGREVLEAAPVFVLDAVFGKLAAKPFMRAAATASLAARTGTKLTSSGLLKALTTNTLRASTDKAVEKLAKSEVAAGLIRESIKTGRSEITSKAIKAYNSSVAAKLGVRSALFTTAASRSTANMYGALYQQIRSEMPELSEEEARDRAWSFATAGGVVVGLVTSGFAAFGRGGFDDVFLKGASFKQVKDVVKSLGNVGGITDEGLAKAITEVMDETLKKNAHQMFGAVRSGLRNAGDEALEEGTSEFLSAFVEEMAINKETPIMEIAHRVTNAALIGGIFGATVPAVQMAASRMGGMSPLDTLSQTIKTENKFIEDVASKLQATGSTMTAEEVRRRIKERVITRGGDAVTAQPTQTDLSKAVTDNLQRQLETKQQQLLTYTESEQPDPEATSALQAEIATLQNRINSLSIAPENVATPINTSELETKSSTTKALRKAMRMADADEVNMHFDNVAQRDKDKFSARFESTTAIDLSDLNVVDSKGAMVNFDPSKDRASVDLNLTEYGSRLQNVVEGPDTQTVIKHESQRVLRHNAERRIKGRPSIKARVKRSQSGFLELDNEVNTATQRKVFEVASSGYPNTITRNISYGIPMPDNVDPAAMTEYAASHVYAQYPVLDVKEPLGGTKFESIGQRDRFNPLTGKLESGKVTGFVDANGVGVFNNDPIVVVEMLKAGVPVYVPKSFRGNINPSLILDGDMVVDVVGPTPEGGALESKVAPVEKFAELYYNTSEAARMDNVPFRPTNLPEGVKRFNVADGSPLEENFTHTTEILRALNRFDSELQKTGADRNELAHARMESSSGTLTDSFGPALDDAKQRFIFNAHLFALRSEIQADPSNQVGKLLDRLGVKEAATAQRLLPFIKIGESKKLSNADILQTFIDQKVLNNPDFEANSTPSFSSIVASSVEFFKSQQDYISERRKSEAKASLPDADLDTASGRVNEFIDNFGRSPEGDIADAASIDLMVNNSLDSAIGAVSSDQKLRLAVEDLVADNLFDGSQDVREILSNYSSPDLVGLMTSWMVSSNGRVRNSVKKFITTLDSGAFAKGDALRNALIVTRFASKPNSRGILNNPSVEEFRTLFFDSTGVTLDSEQALNTMVAIDKALRVRLSSSNISASQRVLVAAQNEAVISALGLESNNPESVVNALRKIAKSDANENHRLVADLLLEDSNFIKTVKFVIAEGDADIAGKYTKTMDGKHVVLINKSTGNGRGLVNTLLEEYVHAALSDTLNMSQAQLGAKSAAVARLKGLFNKVEQAYNRSISAGARPNPVIENGLTNLDEFVSHFLLSEDFQKFIKMVEDPRTNFFDRIINSMVSMFRKISGKEMDKYVAAFKDVLDVGRRPRKLTPTHSKALGASTTKDVLFSAPAKEVIEAEVVDTTVDEDQLADEDFDESFDLPEGFFDEVAPSALKATQAMIDFIRGIVPVGISIEKSLDTNGSLVFVSRQESAIFINPMVLAQEIAGLDYVSAKGIIAAKINEELGHTSGYNSLTQQEIDAYVDSLSDQDFEDIIEDYFSNSPEQYAAQAREDLQSSDPQVVYNRKVNLAEEKLRMHQQKVLRGFTTEEDYRFWKNNPSTIAMLKRYFVGSFRRIAANRKVMGSSAGPILNKMIVEMRAMQAGFVRQPNTQSFDANNPTKAIEMFARIADQNTQLSILATAPSEEQSELDVTNIGADAKETRKLQREAAVRFKDGEITREEYQQIVDKLMPLAEFDEVPVPASTEAMLRGLGDSKASGKFKRDLIIDPSSLEEGTEVQLRLDIPAYNNHNVWVVSMHQPTPSGRTGKIYGYSPTGVIKDVNFNVAEKAALGIAEGKAKSTIATMQGRVVPMSAQDAYNYANEVKGEWTEIGMNPQRHSYFYDKKTQTPVVHADEVIQIGGMVLAKNIRYGDSSNFLFSAPTGMVEHTYLKHKTDFDEARQAGRVRVAQDIRQFAGFNVLFHQPDTAFAGEITFDGDELITGKGGVLYPIQFANKNYLWASTKSGVDSLVKNLNAIEARNGGKIYMALTSADVDKLFSSTTMGTGFLKFFKKLTEKPRTYGITKEAFNRIIVEASAAKDKDGKSLGLKLKKGDSLEENMRLLEQALQPDNSIFSVRKAFVEKVAALVGEHLPPMTQKELAAFRREKRQLDKKLIEAEGDDAATKKVVEELKDYAARLKKKRSTAKKANEISKLLLKDNKFASNALQAGKLSKASIMQGLGDMFTEPFLKTFQQLDSAAGHVYAILEIDGKVKGIPTLEHESYPYTIVSVEGNEPTVHILDKSYRWEDVTRDINTKELMSKKAAEYIKLEAAAKAKHDAEYEARGEKPPTFTFTDVKDPRKVYFPTSGVSKPTLEIIKPDQAAQEKSIDLLFSAPTGSDPLVTDVDVSPVVDLLEMPMFELGGEGPKGLIRQKLSKMFFGEVSEPFRRIIQYRSFYQKATEDTIIKFKRNFDRLIKEAYGSYDNAPMELIAAAQGYQSESIIPDDLMAQIEDTFELKMKDIDARRKAGVITRSQANAERSAYEAGREAMIKQEYDNGVKRLEAKKAKALAEISNTSQELASFLVDIRQKYIIPIQKKLVSMGLDKDVALKISDTGEIYLTRSYRMFTDSTYLDLVRNDKDYEDIRDAAMEYFEKDFIRQTAKAIKHQADVDAQPMTMAEANTLAKQELDRYNLSNPHSGYGQQALDAFLSQYDNIKTGGVVQSPKGFKMLMNNLQKRKDLPLEIRNLLGEHGAEEGTNLILKTYATVANIAAQKTFLEQLKRQGIAEGLMITAETKYATKENRDKYRNWKSLRSEQSYGSTDPMTDVFVHPDFHKSLEMTLNSSFVKDYADTTERAFNGMATIAANLSGKAMAAKTLGSVGFYLRNAIGNLFFGTAQGFLRWDLIIKSMSVETFRELQEIVKPNGTVDPVVTELIGLGVLGDALRANILRDLLNGKRTPEGLQRNIEELVDKSKLNLPLKALKAIEEKASAMSEALDSGFKLVYYQFELGYLERAAAANPEGKYGQMTRKQLKREAARKVLMTTQAYSQASPVIKRFTKSSAGLVFAPFIRFKAEMFRIPFNTYKLAAEEIRSGDPIIRSRGIRRMSFMTAMIGGISSSLAAVFAAISGVGDDEMEDEAMRAGIPDYLRGNTFFYLRDDEGNITSYDFTFLNPFAGIVDPILRALPHILDGEFSDAGAALFKGYILGQFFDNQILAGSLVNAFSNENPSTGKPIWNKGVDDPIEVVKKLMFYVADEAYNPRLLKDMIDGSKAGTLEGFGAELLDGFKPIRSHSVDLQRQFERYILDHNKRFANVKSDLSRLKSKDNMTQSDVQNIIDDNIDARRKMNHELMRVAKGYNSLGLDSAKVLGTMKAMNIGKNRVQLLTHGYMDRPSIDHIAQYLMLDRSSEYGPQRLEYIINHMREINRYIPVVPVTQSE